MVLERTVTYAPGPLAPGPLAPRPRVSRARPIHAHESQSAWRLRRSSYSPADSLSKVRITMGSGYRNCSHNPDY
jgi:hypothetical protein